MEVVNIYGVQQESNFFVLSQQKSSASVPRFPLTTGLASNKVKLNRNKTKQIGIKENQGNEGTVPVIQAVQAASRSRRKEKCIGHLSTR
jgi:hypothetical protein